MVNFAEANPFLARLRETPRRIRHYSRTRDVLSLKRAHVLASVRAENLSKAAVEGAYKQRARARYLSLRRKVLETHGLELNSALLMRLRDYFFNYYDEESMRDMRTSDSFTVKVNETEVYRLDRAGEGLFRACVWAYESWKEHEVDFRRWSGCYRALAKGEIERKHFARLRWKRLRMKWDAVDAWKKRVHEHAAPK